MSKIITYLRVNDAYICPAPGTVDEADGTYMLTTTMDSYLVKGSLLGAIRYVGNEFEFRTNTRYSIYDGPQHTVAINTRMMKDITGADSVYTATVNTKVSICVHGSKCFARIFRDAF